MNDHPKPSSPAPKRSRLWVQGLLLGVGLVLMGLLTWVFMRGTTAVSPTSEKEAGQVQQVQPPPDQRAAAPRVGPKGDAQPIASLKSQIEQVLTGIKEANQKKDISQLLSYYSPNFPQLPQRAKSISKNWKVYDYPKMEFEIKDVRLDADNHAVLKVTWKVEAQNISTKKYKDMSKTYLVRFVKESGQWRIKALEKTE